MRVRRSGPLSSEYPPKACGKDDRRPKIHALPPLTGSRDTPRCGTSLSHSTNPKILSEGIFFLEGIRGAMNGKGTVAEGVGQKRYKAKLGTVPKGEDREVQEGKKGMGRRRPTLPRSHPRSTIGAEELNDRVRDGNGCDLLAVATAPKWRWGHELNRGLGEPGFNRLPLGWSSLTAN